jgi:hypothetical protein
MRIKRSALTPRRRRRPVLLKQAVPQGLEDPGGVLAVRQGLHLAGRQDHHPVPLTLRAKHLQGLTADQGPLHAGPRVAKVVRERLLVVDVSRPALGDNRQADQIVQLANPGYPDLNHGSCELPAS